jgi:hypothetical protein
MTEQAARNPSRPIHPTHNRDRWGRRAGAGQSEQRHSNAINLLFKIANK